ncbi:phosphodiesterase [Derxia gummosa]|uniref:Phosphodiesterase n=1 Tax=Derxia gummosa DSM 723 TaxID=1121388 RepID=A0A8B6X6H2_9BURK|nr:phosphodiesterase [Derxia gummosa]
MTAFCLAQLSDLHVSATPLQGIVPTEPMARAAVAAVLRAEARPDACVLTGDLVDAGTADSYALLADLLRPLEARMPVYLMPGNHDARGPLREVFTHHRYLPAEGRLNYRVEIGPLALIALDTLVEGSGHGCVDAATLGWLDAALAAESSRPTIVALHHPPFATGIAFMDRLGVREGAAELEAVIARHPQVKRVIAGHVHRAITLGWAGTIGMTAPSTAQQIALEPAADAPEAFVMEPPGWLLHRRGGGVLRSAVMPVERSAGPIDYA